MTESKNYTTYQDGKLMIEVSFLDKHYPLLNVPKPGMTPQNDNGQSVAIPLSDDSAINPEKLLHEIELLKLELKYRDQITQEKDKQIELLERSLLMLGEGRRKDQDKAEVIQEEPEEPEEPAALPGKKRRWWQW